MSVISCALLYAVHHTLSTIFFFSIYISSQRKEKIRCKYRYYLHLFICRSIFLLNVCLRFSLRYTAIYFIMLDLCLIQQCAFNSSPLHTFIKRDCHCIKAHGFVDKFLHIRSRFCCLYFLRVHMFAFRIFTLLA